MSNPDRSQQYLQILSGTGYWPLTLCLSPSSQAMVRQWAADERVTPELVREAIEASAPAHPASPVYLRPIVQTLAAKAKNQTAEFEPW